MKKEKSQVTQRQELAEKACGKHPQKNEKGSVFATASPGEHRHARSGSGSRLYCEKPRGRKRGSCPWVTPAARPSRCRTETRSCQPTSARSGRPDNFSAGAWRRPANSVTPLPGSAAGRRTWGRGHPGRDGSRRRPGSHHGSEGPGGATRGSWVAGAGWDPGPRRTRSSRSVRPSVPAPALRAQAAGRRSFTVRLRGPPSARPDPHYCFRRRRRRSADGHRALLRPAPAACANPEPPTGRAAGPAHGPGAPRGRPAARSRSRPLPPAPARHPRPRAHPVPGSAARISRPSAWRTWTRPARLPPAPANSSSRRLAGADPRGARRAWGGGAEAHTRGEWTASKSGA